MKTKNLLCLLLVLLLPLHAYAGVALPAVFGDHMVLQRDTAVPVWGTGAPGEAVQVAFAGQTKSVTTGPDGKWMVKLDPLAASEQGSELKIQGTNSIIFTDVVVGDVWLASGQSNMGFGLNAALNATEAIAKAEDPGLRFFTITKATAAEPRPDLNGKWELSTPQTAGGFSAVAYFFAKELRRTEKCPIAVLHGSWGGTPLQIWMGIDAFRKDPPITKSLDLWNHALADYQKVQANPQLEADYKIALKQWQTDVAPAFDAEFKKYNDDKAAGKPVGRKPTPPTPEPTNPDPMAIPSPSKRPHTPSVAFNAMIYPLAPYALKGAVWYQGEENGSAGIEYRTLLPRLIENWRALWGQGDFPFLIVQLPNNGPDTSPVADRGWPYLREAQLMALSLPQTAIAVTIDVGDPSNVHPKDKLDVGNRLALAARKLAYGEDIVGSGPVYKSSTHASGEIRIQFTDVGSGLMIGQTPWLAPGREPLPTDKLVGFYISGDDKKWVEADAVIDGNTVVVSSMQVHHPVAVRYGWANSPRCNLYNKERLPASPFRTDNW